MLPKCETQQTASVGHLPRSLFISLPLNVLSFSPMCLVADHGLLCSDCMYDHSHSACNIRPVKLVDIVEKWDTAHKNLEILQEQFNRIRCNIENDFPQDCSDRDQDWNQLFSDLRAKFAFFSDLTAQGILKALECIEKELEPLHSADPSTECGQIFYCHFCFEMCNPFLQFRQYKTNRSLFA